MVQRCVRFPLPSIRVFTIRYTHNVAPLDSPSWSHPRDPPPPPRHTIRRHQCGLTHSRPPHPYGPHQEELAASLGISNQQVQKYETGASRVSTARLFEL